MYIYIYVDMADILHENILLKEGNVLSANLNHFAKVCKSLRQ